MVMTEPEAISMPVEVIVPPLMFKAEVLATRMPLVTAKVPPVTVSRELAAPAFRPTLTDFELTMAEPETVMRPLALLPALKSPERFAVPPLKVASPLAPHPTFMLCS